MKWYKVALMLNDPNNVEEQIFREIADRSDQEIQDLVDQNYDYIVGQAKKRLDLGVDLENVVEEITKDFGREMDFSPKRSLEWSTLWACIFEIIQPLASGQGDEWETLEL